MSDSNAISALEEKLGYSFRDPVLLMRALTAPARRMDHPLEKDNQRLEFLGDAVIGLLSADFVFGENPDEQEGPLTVRRTHLVSGAALARAAETLGLREHMRLNAGAPPIPPRSKILTDALEAVMGAVWLDGGLDAARAAFRRLDLPFDEKLDEWSANPKGHLQVRAQAMKPPRKPEYEVVSMKGPAHDPEITVTVKVADLGEATATGRSVRAAESAAASKLLASLAR